MLAVSGDELYAELVRWRARLHGRAAGELHAFLTTNLMLLTKVWYPWSLVKPDHENKNVSWGKKWSISTFDVSTIQEFYMKEISSKDFQHGEFLLFIWPGFK
jgi:hypothetical protein